MPLASSPRDNHHEVRVGPTWYDSMLSIPWSNHRWMLVKPCRIPDISNRRIRHGELYHGAPDVPGFGSECPKIASNDSSTQKFGWKHNFHVYKNCDLSTDMVSRGLPDLCLAIVTDSLRLFQAGVSKIAQNESMAFANPVFLQLSKKRHWSENWTRWSALRTCFCFFADWVEHVPKAPTK